MKGCGGRRRNADAHISWLRLKLGSGEFIETVPKRGYRFAAKITTSEGAEIFVDKTTLPRVRVEETRTISDAKIFEAASKHSSQPFVR